LHDLDILDKHTALVPVGLAHTQADWTVGLVIGGLSVPEISIPFRPRRAIYPLKDGDVIATSKTFDGNPHRERFEANFAVAFGEGQIVDGEPVIVTLQQFVNFVERVIRIFVQRFFGTA
jgi:hypothetical protein